VKIVAVVHELSRAGASLVATATLTVGAELVAPPETTSYGCPLPRTFTIKEGINGGIPPV